MRGIGDIKDLNGKTVLYRAPYDIDVKEVNGVFELADDLRIEATLPTLKYLLENQCKIVILTYVKRPDGEVVESLRTDPHAKRLSELLNHEVMKINECIGEEADKKIRNLKNGEILMLENVRFYKEEMIDDDNFAKELCKGKDLIVFDGFPQAHRMHSSTTGIQRYLRSYAGFYLEKEVKMLSKLLVNPKHPFTVVIGGAKISDKVDAINNLLRLADTVIVGGAVATIFLKAQGRNLGDSMTEDVFVDKARREKKDWVLYAKDILKEAEKLGKKIITPSDLVVSNGLSKGVVDINIGEVPKGWMALDIGPETRKKFAKIIEESRTVFMNGPMGKSEDSSFAQGSAEVLDALKKNKGETIIAGGNTIDLIRDYGKISDFTYVSLAGGATLEFLAGKELPALVPLMKESLE